MSMYGLVMFFMLKGCCNNALTLLGCFQMLDLCCHFNSSKINIKTIVIRGSNDLLGVESIFLGDIKHHLKIDADITFLNSLLLWVKLVCNIS